MAEGTAPGSATRDDRCEDPWRSAYALSEGGADTAAGRGIEVDEEALKAQTDALEAQIEGESTALFSTGRLWDDGIIHPGDSRTVMGIALSAAHSNVVQGATEYGVWRH